MDFYSKHNKLFNGTNSASKNPQVTFNSIGTFTIKLIASNSAGSDSMTKTITTKNYKQPVADFSAILPLLKPDKWFLSSISRPMTLLPGYGISVIMILPIPNILFILILTRAVILWANCFESGREL